MRNIYAIGETVTANNTFTGMIVEVSIRKNDVMYRLQQTYEDDVKLQWFYSWEITTKAKKMTLISECLRSDNSTSLTEDDDNELPSHLRDGS